MGCHGISVDVLVTELSVPASPALRLLAKSWPARERTDVSLTRFESRAPAFEEKLKRAP